MTCTISPSNHTFSRRSYVSLTRDDYKHLSTWTQFDFILQHKDLKKQTTAFSSHNQINIPSPKLISQKYIARQPSRRSMVKAEDAPKRKTSTSRSAGQALSPQTIAQDTVSIDYLCENVTDTNDSW